MAFQTPNKKSKRSLENYPETEHIDPFQDQLNTGQDSWLWKHLSKHQIAVAKDIRGIAGGIKTSKEWINSHSVSQTTTSSCCQLMNLSGS